jgi:hypothetical protein
MSVSSEKPSSERPAEIGPPPYYHRSDCNICRKQDGLKTGSGLLDAPIPGGYVAEGEYFLVEHAPPAVVRCRNGHRRDQAASPGFR